MQPLKYRSHAKSAELKFGVEPAGTDDILPFVETRYRTVHAAQSIRLLPAQFTVRDANDHLLATAGFQCAGGTALFLEHYLDLPVEQSVADSLRRPVARDEIVEIGNLAAVGGHTHTLILAMMRYLATSNCRYVVFTLTSPVRATFRRMGLPLTALTAATPDRVPQPEVWGAYYAKHPLVMVGEIAAGFAALASLPNLEGDTSMPSTLESSPCKPS
ncbi:thermostable hemolysin [Chitinimonas naiadis]